MPSGSSSRWLDRQRRDPYVKAARRHQLRSRAWFKLQGLCEPGALFKPGQCVVDLGAAPGGWSHYARQCVGPSGRVIACDLLPMTPLKGVEFFLGDFCEPETVAALLKQMRGCSASVLLSDMSPNLSGHSLIDQARMDLLVDQVCGFATHALGYNGTLILKSFQGEQLPQWRARLSRGFCGVALRKPEASRLDSRECYFVATGFKRTIF